MIEYSVKVSNTYMKLDHHTVQSVFEVAIMHEALDLGAEQYQKNDIRGTIRSENIKVKTYQEEFFDKSESETLFYYF